ncbi:MAG: Ig domain-containing protein [Bacteroidales bacterium]|nr:Ig domain-containing protein [Candidatus Liminaster caballi]
MTTGAGTPAWTVSSSKWKFGSSKTVFWSEYTLSTNKFNSYNITKVQVGCYDNGGTESSVTVKQGSITIGSATVSTTTTSNVETLNEAQGEGGALQITFTSTKQASYITSIKVWYTLGGDAVHVESVTLDQHNLVVMESKSATLTATVAPVNATNQNVAWSSSNTDVATVDGGVVKGKSEGTATITVTTSDGSFTDQCLVTVTPKEAPAGSVFYESFDQLEGSGGNDDVWSGISGTYAWETEVCDNEGWTTEGTMNKGAQCASIRKGTSGGKNIASGLTTPAIGVAGNGNITFNAQSWGTDTGDFYVDIVGGGTFLPASGVTLSNSNKTAKVTLTKKSEWGDYDLSFIGLTANSKFRFYMAAGKRGFLDEVAIFVTPSNEGTLDFAAEDGAGSGDYYATFSSTRNVVMPATPDANTVIAVYALAADGSGLSFVDFDVDFDNTDSNGDIIIPANTGVLVYAITTNPSAPSVTYSYTEETGSGYDPEFNLLRPASVAMEGDFKFYKLAYDDYTNKTGLGFYWGAADGAAFTAKAGGAYLAVPTSSSASLMRGFSFDDINGSETAIEEVAIESVEQTTSAYSLTGQRVEKVMNNGLYIVGGEVKYMRVK